jgi:hexosaminidase
MKPRPGVLIFALATFSIAALKSQQSVNTLVRVIPTPQRVQIAPLLYRLTSQTRIILGEGTAPPDEFAMRQINVRLAELQRGPLRIVREKEVRKISRDYIFLGPPRGPFAKNWMNRRRLSLEPQMKDEGYLLDVSEDGVVILGETTRGRFYGVMTLLQILDQQRKSVTFPGVTIHDWPQMRFRGITDDLSRGQVSTAENFKKIIRFLARYKLNVYSPYIEDIFVFRQHPLIGRGRGELTAAEVMELDAYAKQYHVELIPIFETLGHWENILVLPEYLRYAEFPGASTLNVSDEAIYPLLDGMISEVSAAFSSPYFNIAADESFNVGLGASKSRVTATDLATVHAEHYKRLFEILRKYKKKAMMYGDIILANPAILKKIPKDVVIVDWQYDAAERYPSTQTFREAGFPFIVSPAVWNSNGPFPDFAKATVNVENLCREGFRNGSLGVLTSSWNNYGGESLRELNYYGYAWSAECAWRPLEANLERFNEIFFLDFFGDEHSALAAGTIYALLSSPLSQINWHELWRHPLLPPRLSSQPLTVRIASLRLILPIAVRLLGELKESVPEHNNHIRLLSFVVRLHEWFASKVVVAEALKQVAEDSGKHSANSNLRREVLARARDLVAELHRLKNEFSSLWLETNRSANLQLLMMRYDRQIRYWEETIRTLEQKGVIKDPLIESQWIYHPDAHPGGRDSTLLQVSTAYFTTKIELEQVASSARLQLIGDTHVRLWVNGHLVGEVYARRSPSLTVENERVKMWDIRSFLRPGENILALEATNYDRYGSAGVNVYAELEHNSGMIRVMSDSTWHVSVKPPTDWKTSLEPGEGWVRASSMQYPYLVVRPDFENGRLSWIER